MSVRGKNRPQPIRFGADYFGKSTRPLQPEADHQILEPSARQSPQPPQPEHPGTYREFKLMAILIACAAAHDNGDGDGCHGFWVETCGDRYLVKRNKHYADVVFSGTYEETIRYLERQPVREGREWRPFENSRG
jgi:hypothetical protein